MKKEVFDRGDQTGEGELPVFYQLPGDFGMEQPNQLHTIAARCLLPCSGNTGGSIRPNMIGCLAEKTKLIDLYSRTHAVHRLAKNLGTTSWNSSYNTVPTVQDLTKLILMGDVTYHKPARNYGSMEKYGEFRTVRA